MYEALKRGALEHAIVTGEFVRAEGKPLPLQLLSTAVCAGSSTLAEGGKRGVVAQSDSTVCSETSFNNNNNNNNNTKKQLGRDAVIDSTNCIIRIQTNKKAVWQHAM